LESIKHLLSNRNDNLVSLLNDIFNYWFIQFNFPDDNGSPYKTSGGSMIWNYELNKHIPNNWTVSTLSNECVTKLGGTPDTSISEYWGGSIPWLNSGEVAYSPVVCSENSITEKGMINSATSFSKAGAILLSITRYIRPSLLGIDACYNQSVVSIEPNERLQTAFLLPFFQSMVPTYMKLRTGAQQPHINKKVVDDTYILIPSDDILSQYYKIVNPMIFSLVSCAKENIILRNIRDESLPLLMNGQATIS